MLKVILGSETAAKIMLYLIHYGEAYANGVAKDMGITLSQVQKQFDKFETGGVLISKKIGTVRLYQFNQKLGIVKKFITLVEAFYEGIPLEQREKMFSERRRPRRRGKPVL
jgi:DNA-binding transcriptional ArsR family regulator